MNLVLDPNLYDDKGLYFYEPVKNTVMDESSFIRILYSNCDLILNGIYIKIDIDKNIYLKRPIKFSSTNEAALAFVENLENNILQTYNSKKISSKKIKEQLIYLISKIHSTSSTDTSYILKISGIWETINTIGLTFKFVYIYPTA
jgi:hypothetical protein